eukprot:TRINITY_DN8153_c0_g1_i1.p1 TRINITY_DN8153_c0_g1~~TRINITY_DN8153_c0_g1_i1.p1  ORF type:complete len:488 (-),score=68.55 TRINITY_DN8153_c0_g1_i1:37-1500(-)
MFLTAVLGLIFLLLVFILYEQVQLYRKRQGLPGPRFIFPIFGQIFSLIKDPTTFWENQEKYGRISYNSVFGKFLLFSSETQLTRKFFSNTSGDFHLYLIFNAEKILGKNNIAFLNGPHHKELRKQLLPLFTRKAMSTYIHIQEKLIREHLKQWSQLSSNGQFIELRPLVRDLNVQTSITVFVGPYTTEAIRKEFFHNYFIMNEGLLSFPLAYPGSLLSKAIQAREKVVDILQMCAVKSRERIKNGGEPECLIDYWIEEQERIFKKSIESEGKIPPPLHSTPKDIANTVLDFLFASQDASTASLVWVAALLHQHPEVIVKVREEQDRLRPNDEPLNYDLLCTKMMYTRQVVKEVLRFRAPATLVPHIATKDAKIPGENFIVPKGTIVFPSVWCSHFQGYSDPFKFDPDRFGSERGEDVKYAKHFLAFGKGSHYCLGKDYAMNHLTAFIGLLSSNYDWTRKFTESSDKIVYGPTIYPSDCLINIGPRVR